MSNNNKNYASCPPRMDDGRHFTDYRPNCFVNNLIHVGIRIIPIGQETGQDCLFRLMPNIKSLAEKLANSSLYDLRGGAFFADLLSMQHEYSEQRIFRT